MNMISKIIKLKDTKYELIKDDYVIVEGRTLYCIKALKDFGCVKTDDLGGYIEKEENLSHEGNCWVAGDAKVYGDATVIENALVSDYAVVKDRAIIGDMAFIGDGAVISNKAYIRGIAIVVENAKVGGEVDISDNSYIDGNAFIKGEGFVCSNTYIGGDTDIDGNFEISSCTITGGQINGTNVVINDGSSIFSGTNITGNVTVNGSAVINFKLEHTTDYFTYRDPARPYVIVTAAMKEDIWNVGGFSGTAKEFIEYGYNMTDTNGKSNEEMVEYHNNLKSKYWGK